jgi:hypothetical protein
MLLAPGAALPGKLFGCYQAALRTATLNGHAIDFVSRKERPACFRRKSGCWRQRPMVRAQGRFLLLAMPLSILCVGGRLQGTACSLNPINNRVSPSRLIPNGCRTSLTLSYCGRSGNELLSLRSIVLLSARGPSPELDDYCEDFCYWPARLFIVIHLIQSVCCWRLDCEEYVDSV